MAEKHLFIITHTSSTELNGYSTFKENIANNFISKIATPSSTIIISLVNTKAHNVFSLLVKGINEEDQNALEIFVVEMNDFYGTLSIGTWEWIESQTNENFITEGD